VIAHHIGTRLLTEISLIRLKALIRLCRCAYGYLGAAALQHARIAPAKAKSPPANVKPPQSKATKLSGSEGQGRSTVIGMQSKCSASTILGGDLADILGGEQFPAGSCDETHCTLLACQEMQAMHGAGLNRF